MTRGAPTRGGPMAGNRGGYQQRGGSGMPRGGVPRGGMMRQGQDMMEYVEPRGSARGNHGHHGPERGGRPPRGGFHGPQEMDDETHQALFNYPRGGRGNGPMPSMRGGSKAEAGFNHD